jgi:hypothetical protein
MPRDKSSDVDEFDGRWNDLLGLRDGGERGESWSGTSTMPIFGSIVQNG